MFLVDCHCDTLSELYKQNKSLYANDLMLDAAQRMAAACSLWPCSFPQKCSGRGLAQPIR